MTLWWTALCFS